MEYKLWHLLELANGEEDVKCQRCRKSVLGIPTYKCSDCKFFVHESCGEEPNRGMEVEHHLREIHHVISTELGKYGEEEAVCSLCEKRVPHPLGKNVSFIYRCIIPKCKFLTHDSCIELPVMTVDYSHHPCHPLFLKPPSSSRGSCRICEEKIIYQTDGFDGSFYYCCEPCSYRIHANCGTRWKDEASKCKPHKHFANWKPKLIEFTCDVCGNKSIGMGLHCIECRLLIHTDCDRFICDLKETGHQHPLTFTLSLSQDKHNICQACGVKVDTNYEAYYCPQEACEYVFHLFCGYVVEQQGGTNDAHGCPPYLIDWTGDEKDVGPKNHPSHSEHELIWKNEEPKDKVRQGVRNLYPSPHFTAVGNVTFVFI